MKQNLNNTYLFLLLFSVLLHACSQVKNSSNKIETYDQFREQKIEPRDSAFILYTVKEWGKKMWFTWGVRTDIYKIKYEQVNYFIGGTFYSSDRKKILIWIGEEMPNAPTIKTDRDTPQLNKICPNGADTIFTLSALIGIRDSANQIWKLFPFDQQTAGCFDSKEKVINILGQYYFGQMKTHQMYRMMQSGKKKGFLELQAYGYNLQDKDFWDRCWLFQKDTVGSYGLYPLQIKGYDYHGDKCSPKCAEPYNPPTINYPTEILKLYNR